jgi:hypothetical protein
VKAYGSFHTKTGLTYKYDFCLQFLLLCLRAFSTTTQNKKMLQQEREENGLVLEFFF